MSKAFTRESDEDVNDLPLPVRVPLPPGVKNYITPAGAARLRQELERLIEMRGKDATSAGPADHRAPDARARQLQEIIASLVVAEPAPAGNDVVRFGASVTLQRPGETAVYRIVGVDETDIDRNEISWLSPLAKALMGRRAGDRLRFRAPSGEEEITILSVRYEAVAPTAPRM